MTKNVGNFCSWHCLTGEIFQTLDECFKIVAWLALFEILQTASAEFGVSAVVVSVSGSHMTSVAMARCCLYHVGTIGIVSAFLWVYKRLE